MPCKKESRAQRPDLVIQAGIGGAVSNEDIGKSFAIRSEQIADLGVMEKTGFRNIFEMGLDKPDRLSFQAREINKSLPRICWNGRICRVMDGITVNEIKSARFCRFSTKHRSGC